METEQERRAHFDRLIGASAPSDDARPLSELELLASITVVSAAIGAAIGIAASTWAASQDLPWFGEHPELTGVLVFLVALILGRAYLFMRRLESR